MDALYISYIYKIAYILKIVTALNVGDLDSLIEWLIMMITGYLVEMIWIVNER